MGSWRELATIAGEFRALDAVVFGVSADTPERHAKLRENLQLPFALLSDPMLETARVVAAPTASKANLLATAVLHRVVLTYPKRSFLQPALFVWRRDGTLAHQWRQTESSLTNRYGARGRPRADQVLEIVRRAVG